MLSRPLAFNEMPIHDLQTHPLQDTMNTMVDEPRGPKQQWISIEKYLQLGFTIPAATFIGWLIGTGLDHWTGRQSFSLGGLIFGTVAGFVYFIRTAMSEDFKD